MPMNPKPQRKSIWKLLLVTIRYALVIVASAYVVDVSGRLAFHMAIPMRGKPSADVGVVVYEHPERATAFWLLAFSILSYFSLFIIKRMLCQNSNLPYWIGIVLSIPCSLYFLYFLGW